ncbi:MAG: hypothetical protein ACXIVE_06415, partial [Salinarimonas sp.]
NTSLGQLAYLLEKGGAQLSGNLDQRGQALIAEIETTMGNLAGALERSGQELGERFDARGDALVGQLGSKVDQLESLIDVRGAGLVQALGDRSQHLARDIAQAGDNVVRSLELQGGRLLDTLQERSTELQETYSRSSEALRSAIDEGSQQAIDALVSTNERIRSELGSVLVRLHDANRVLEDVARRAGGNLGEVEQSLSGRISEISGLLAEVAEQTNAATGRISEQAQALRAISAGALHEAGELASTLDARGEALAESTQRQIANLSQATHMLEQLERRMGAGLTGRSEALEQLLARVEERAGEMESVSSRFTELVEGSLANAEGKAKQIGAVLADTAQSSSAAISRQFEDIRRNTEGERERTATAIREAYEGVARDMQGALEGASGQFRAATEELRAMTAQIQKELDTTRNELKRSLAQLPQETEETTTSMRRVVADQIKALNELSSLVTRSSRAVDVVQADAARVGAQVSAASANAARGTATTQATSSTSQSAMAAVAEAITRPQPPTRPQTASVEPSAPSPAVAQPVPEPAREQPFLKRDSGVSGNMAGNKPRVQRAEQSGGWLSDLLLRASREDEGSGEAAKPAESPARAPQPERTEAQPSRANTAGNGQNALDSLNAISVDIARMVDHGALAGAWDRFNRGETNVFTREIYTEPGRQTFEEIRRKYAREPEFRRTVDRYVEEFERLLREVSRDDRDQLLTRSYLVSETGKVYTMLAHASGRLG